MKWNFNNINDSRFNIAVFTLAVVRLPLHKMVAFHSQQPYYKQEHELSPHDLDRLFASGTLMLVDWLVGELWVVLHLVVLTAGSFVLF